LTSGNIIQTVLYAYYQATIVKSNDELQVAVNELNEIIKRYNMKISPSKTKAMGFCGK
jgi:hypothetical protein